MSLTLEVHNIVINTDNIGYSIEVQVPGFANRHVVPCSSDLFFQLVNALGGEQGQGQPQEDFEESSASMLEDQG